MLVFFPFLLSSFDLGKYEEPLAFNNRTYFKRTIFSCMMLLVTQKFPRAFCLACLSAPRQFILINTPSGELFGDLTISIHPHHAFIIHPNAIFSLVNAGPFINLHFSDIMLLFRLINSKSVFMSLGTTIFSRNYHVIEFIFEPEIRQIQRGFDSFELYAGKYEVQLMGSAATLATTLSLMRESLGKQNPFITRALPIYRSSKEHLFYYRYNIFAKVQQKVIFCTFRLFDRVSESQSIYSSAMRCVSPRSQIARFPRITRFSRNL